MLKDQHTDLLTASVSVVDLATGEIRYANAGHPPTVLTDGVERRELEPTGPLVGAFAATWTTGETVLPRGWTMFVHTDGLTDILGADRERFGRERLHACLDDPEPRALIACVQTTTEEFRIGPRSDDCTAIAIHRHLEPVDAVVGTDPGGDLGTAMRASDASVDHGTVLP